MGLFSPAWKSKNEEKALKAIEKMTDQRKLERAARDAYCRRARQAAIEKLTDQTVLADIAKNDKDWYVRETAVKELTDQAVLTDISINDIYDVRRTAIAKLTGKECDMSEAVVEKLTDQAWIADVAKNDKVYYVRLAAITKLTDQNALADIAKYDKDEGLRQAATAKLTDQNVLAYIAKNDKNWYVCKAALANIKDPKYLHLKCDGGIHTWVTIGTCRKTCSLCGRKEYNHEYQTTKHKISGVSDDLMYDTEYRCEKCGHEASTHYGYPDDTDSRKIGVIKT
jgi:hypothetical protein